MRFPRGMFGRRPAGRILIVLGDITAQPVDAIVNAAKSSLLGGGGVDGAIHAAGGPRILAECRELRTTTYPDGLPVGSVALTSGGDMPAKWVIHTVGPRYLATRDRTALLRSCYRNSLGMADTVHAASVAFPLISAGVYGWPTHDAIWQALDTLKTTPTRVKTVRLVLFDPKTFVQAQYVWKGMRR